MKIDTFANRLNEALNVANIKQVDLANKTKIDKSLINKYLKGIAEAGNDNLPLLAQVLGVNEVWLMGYDVPMNMDKQKSDIKNVSYTPDEKDKVFDEVDILFNKHKDILSESDKAIIKTIIEERIKEIDKELGED